MATSPIVIDPATGERVQSSAPQIDPATGERMPAATAAPEQNQPGFFGSLAHSFGLPGSWDELKAAATAQQADLQAHPFKNLIESLGGPTYQVGKAVLQQLGHSGSEAKQGIQSLREGNVPDAVVHGIHAIPIVGPAAQALEEQAPATPGRDFELSDITPGMVGTTVGTAAQLAPLALSGADAALPSRPTITAGPALNRAAKNVIAGDVNAPMPGTDVTPAARYEAMRTMGIQPDAAQATNNALLPRAVKAGNQFSLTSASTYEAAQKQNLDVLDKYAHDAVEEIDPGGRDGGEGSMVQRLLQAHAAQKSVAQTGFDQLDEQLGSGTIPGALGIRAAARRILAENQLTSVSPALEPGKALAIVKDIAGLDDTGAPLKNPPALTYGQMQRLRSNLLEFNNNNPDLVKNEADSWISSLAGKVDDAMTAPRGGMSADQVQLFRDSNAAWKNIKDTFDNPQHPFYQAVRTVAPSQVPTMLSQGLSRTPDIVSDLRNAVGPEGIGPIRRAVLEKALGVDANGDYNFKTFQRNFNKIPQNYRDALFTPEQQQQFSQIGDAGTVLSADVNPSGTAKQTQKAAELVEAGASLAHPALLGKTALYHAAQFTLGKVMNHPEFVDWLMRQPGATPSGPTAGGMVLPMAAVSSTAQSEKDPHTGPDGQPNFYSDLYLRSKMAFDAARAAENNQ